MIGHIILGIVVLFLAVIFIRAAMFQPKAQPEVSAEEVKVDTDAAVSNLQRLVQCKTVSYNDRSLEDEAEFQKLLSLAKKLLSSSQKSTSPSTSQTRKPNTRPLPIFSQRSKSVITRSSVSKKNPPKFPKKMSKMC